MHYTVLDNNNKDELASLFSSVFSSSEGEHVRALPSVIWLLGTQHSTHKKTGR